MSDQRREEVLLLPDQKINQNSYSHWNMPRVCCTWPIPLSSAGLSWWLMVVQQPVP